MKELLKYDIVKMFKNKKLHVILLIASCVLAMTLLISGILYNPIAGIEKETDFTWSYFLTKLFSFVLCPNSLLILLPIFIIMYVCDEFKDSSFRNKIITGHSRFKIVLSIFISSLFVSTLFMLINFLIIVIYDLSLFPTLFSNSYFVSSLFIGFINEMFYLYSTLAIVVLFSILIKKCGLTIITCCAILIFGSSSLSALISSFSGEYSFYLFHLVPFFHLVSGYFFTFFPENLELLIIGISSNIVYVIVLFLISTLIFKKLEIK